MKAIFILTIIFSALSFNGYSKNDQISERIKSLKSIQETFSAPMNTEVLTIIRSDYKSSNLIDNISSKNATDPVLLKSLINSVDPARTTDIEILESAIGRILIKQFIKI